MDTNQFFPPVVYVYEKIETVVSAWNRVVDRHPNGIACFGWVVLSVSWGLGDPIGLPDDQAMLGFLGLMVLGGLVLVPEGVLHSKFTAPEYIAAFMTIGVVWFVFVTIVYANGIELGAWTLWALMPAVGAWTAAAAVYLDYGFDLLLGNSRQDDSEVNW